MIMTQFAMMDPGPAGDSFFSRCCRGIAHFFGFGDRPDLTAPRHSRPGTGTGTSPERDVRPALRVVPATPLAPVTEMKWRRHEQLRRPSVEALDTDERRARQHAVRGLYAAHAGDLAEAEQYFTSAARHEAIDFGEIPGFWALQRDGIMTAVRAYESAGRLREASALSARIRTELRPRALSPVPRNVTALPPRRVSLTGNS